MKIKTQSTTMPPEQLSLEAWLRIFRVGLMAPKPINDRPKLMMKGYDFKKLRVQSDSIHITPLNCLL
jgi:hypothetical protein